MMGWPAAPSGSSLLFSLAAATLALAGADIQTDLYRAAARSTALTGVTADTAWRFVDDARSKSAVILFFHDPSCHICHSALPEFEKIARQLRSAGHAIAFGHIDASISKAKVKEFFHLKGAPSMVGWRMRDRGKAGDLEKLVGESLNVLRDEAVLLRSSRHAGMSKDLDPKRISGLGKIGQVVGVDTIDHSAKVKISSIGSVWFPLEALGRGAEGPSLPFPRSEAAVHYSNRWDEVTMLRFIERFLRPLIGSVDSRSALIAAAKGELIPSLVYCGGQPTGGFKEAAAMFQGRVASFHATEEACPVRSSGSHVVVYSSQEQQWAPQRTSAKAAIAVAPDEALRDDGKLIDWISSNRFPGIQSAGIDNFPDILDARRRVLAVAVPPASSAAYRAVAAKAHSALRKHATPTETRDAEEYSYGSGSFYLCVMDGTLPGLELFGILPRSLPRVVVFDKTSDGDFGWFEDETELTLDALPAGLQKLQRMWRMREGLVGYAIGIARDASRLVRFSQEVATALLGAAVGHIIGPLVLALCVLGLLIVMFKSAKNLANSLAGEDDNMKTNSQPDADSKKTL